MAAVWAAGSSPRLRGTRGSRYPGRHVGRFIPAPAGNAIRPSSRRCPRTVHPRACGERIATRRFTPTSAGSSPRLRGTRGHPAPRHQHGRFIPAPAGNAIAWRSRPRSSPVHPRACGERARPVSQIAPQRGSSPRLRGTPEAMRGVIARIRFIPAPAGNALHCISDCGQRAVHPRACGERGTRRPIIGKKPGSSPRLRGTP